MKIIYSYGNLIGAESRFLRFKENSNFEIKLAAPWHYSKNIKNVNWVVDPLYVDKKSIKSILGFDPEIFANVNLFSSILKEVEKFEPDLIISDYDRYFPIIARFFNIKHYNISPLNFLIFGYMLPTRYKSFLLKVKRKIKKIEDGSYFIYSPFYNFPYKMGQNFKWIKPFHKKYNSEMKDYVVYNPNNKEYLNNVINSLNLKKNELETAKWVLLNGTTDEIADVIFNSKARMATTLDFSDPELIMNSALIEEFGIGDSIGNIDILGRNCLNYFEKSFEKVNNFEIKNDEKTLTEIIKMEFKDKL